MRRKQLNTHFLNIGTFRLIEAHILFYNVAWVIIFTLIAYIYYLNTFPEVLASMFKNPNES